MKPIDTFAMQDIHSVYADGGVALSNPSPIAGAFAFVYVNAEGERVYEHCDIIRPPFYGLSVIGNNLMELLAVTTALYYLPERWSGKVYSDSKVTLGRLFEGWQWNGVPKPVCDAYAPIRTRLGKLEPVLLDGHPTKTQLADGIGKRGNPCSVHNVYCDELCTLRLSQAVALRNAALEAAGLPALVAPKTNTRKIKQPKIETA